MDGCRESDRLIVSVKLPNNGAGAPGLAEGVERRGRAKGNLVEHHRGRTQGRETLPQACDWVRQALYACASSPEAGARCGSAARRDLCGGCWVTGIPTATFLLRARGIDEAQAAELRAQLGTFAEEWNSPDMALYDNYDAAKAKL